MIEFKKGSNKTSIEERIAYDYSNLMKTIISDLKVQSKEMWYHLKLCNKLTFV